MDSPIEMSVVGIYTASNFSQSIGRKIFSLGLSWLHQWSVNGQLSRAAEPTLGIAPDDQAWLELLAALRTDNLDNDVKLTAPLVAETGVGGNWMEAK